MTTTARSERARRLISIQAARLRLRGIQLAPVSEIERAVGNAAHVDQADPAVQVILELGGADALPALLRSAGHRFSAKKGAR